VTKSVWFCWLQGCVEVNRLLIRFALETHDHELVGAENRLLFRYRGQISVLSDRSRRGRSGAWGKLHKAQFNHALMPLADKATRPQLSVGPLALGGASNVPHAATHRRSDYELTAGASFRMVLDVGYWDASRTINAPGQSGDPFSGHYRDLAPLWATGQYVPLLYARATVEAATGDAITLFPR
jgi:acyl-homoserine lactone acylase PvdQ